jgi:phosphate transport system substrate-binding protein
MANLKQNNDMAVSPIVATLVLIVVAVIGAVAVGTIMGTFSTDVSKQANTGEVAGQASTEILVAGSTTVQPASEAWAKEFEKKNPSMKISVQGGGSGTGVSSVGMGIVDIGAASRALKDAEKTSYPDLKEFQVGGSAVVFIANTATPEVMSKADLLAIYAATPSFAGANATTMGLTRAYQRAEASGTEETAAEFLGVSAKNFDAFTAISGVTGNAGMVKAVQDNANSIGFCDYGYAKDVSTTNFQILTIAAVGPTTEKAIKAGLKNKFTGVDQTGTAYEQNLVRGLYYFTNGEPSSVVKSFITFAQSPEGGELIKSEDVGMFSLGDIYGA